MQEGKQWTSTLIFGTPNRQSVVPSLPLLAVRRSTQISKDGISELLAMISTSWIMFLPPVSHLRGRVLPTVCDVNHNDSGLEYLMKMTHTLIGGFLTPDGQVVNSNGDLGNDMHFLVTPYGEVCISYFDVYLIISTLIFNCCF